jgi:hypothetical protein
MQNNISTLLIRFIATVIPRMSNYFISMPEPSICCSAELEVELGKSFSQKTLERYIKTWCSR